MMLLIGDYRQIRIVKRSGRAFEPCPPAQKSLAPETVLLLRFGCSDLTTNPALPGARHFIYRLPRKSTRWLIERVHLILSGCIRLRVCLRDTGFPRRCLCSGRKRVTIGRLRVEPTTRTANGLTAAPGHGGMIPAIGGLDFIVTATARQQAAEL